MKTERLRRQLLLACVILGLLFGFSMPAKAASLKQPALGKVSVLSYSSLKLSWKAVSGAEVP